VRDEDGGAVVELEVRNGEALVRHVLGLERAEVLAPRQLRQRVRDILVELARRCA
jgi:predicted DNA-binding transcriptional regulator YafY